MHLSWGVQAVWLGLVVEVWQSREHWISSSHHRFFFLNSNSLWFMQMLCSGQVMFHGATAASLAMVGSGFSHHPTQHLAFSCFTGVLRRIYSCSVQCYLLHIQHSSTVSSAVSSSAFIHTCCDVHCLCIAV